MTTIDIAEMPVLEKLQLMEALWNSLCDPAEGSFASPAWHVQALQQAEADVAAGSANFVDWDDAKNQLRGRGQA